MQACTWIAMAACTLVWEGACCKASAVCCCLLVFITLETSAEQLTRIAPDCIAL